MNTEMDLNYTPYDYLDAFWRRRYFFVTSMICMPIFAVLMIFVLPKTYEAETAIAVYNTAPPSMKDVNYAPVIEEQFASLSAYLTSPAVLKKIALQAGLIPPSASDKVVQRVIVDMAKALTVMFVEKNVVKIKLVQKHPQNMILILKTIADAAVRQLQEPLTLATQASKAFLKHEIDKQRVNLAEAIKQLTLFESTNNAFLPEYGKVYMSRFQQISTELGDKNAQYQSLLAQKSELKDSLLKINPVLGALSKAILDNDILLSKMGLIYTDNYSGIQNALQLGQSLRAERDKIYKHYQTLSESDIQQMWVAAISASGANRQSGALLARQLENFQNVKLKLNGLDKEIHSLNTQQQELVIKLKKVTDIRQQWLSLTQEVQESQRLFDNLVTSYVMTKGTSGFNSADQSLSVKIVSFPQAPYYKATRPLIFYFLVGIVGGAVLGFSLAAIFELIDSSVRRRRVIEALTGIMVICRVEKLVQK